MTARNEINKPDIVRNISDGVSWGQTYIVAAKKAGFRVVEPPDLPESNARLFLGDEILESYLADLRLSMYFLAAYDRTVEELANITSTDITLVPSEASRRQVSKDLAKSEVSKVRRVGFPVDIAGIEKMQVAWEDRVPKSVCWVGRADDDKGLELEEKTTRILLAQGYRISHFAPDEDKNGFLNGLRTLGVEVVVGARGEELFRQIALKKYVINTSPFESLGVGLIEAAALGLIPLAPSRASNGPNDWLPKVLRFAPDGSGLVELLNKLETISGENDIFDQVRRNISYYTIERYFGRVLQIVANHERR